jgi:hypothetical protein
LCANFANPVPIDVACGRGLVAAGVTSMSAGHGPLLVARGCGAAPGLSAEHGPLHVARSRGLAIVVAPGLSVGHGPLRATRDRGPTAAAGLRWTCSLDNSAGG